MTIAAILANKGNEIASIPVDAPLSEAVAELGNAPNRRAAGDGRGRGRRHHCPSAT